MNSWFKVAAKMRIHLPQPDNLTFFFFFSSKFSMFQSLVFKISSPIKKTLKPFPVFITCTAKNTPVHRNTQMCTRIHTYVFRHTRGVSDRKLARATVEIRIFAFLTQRARKNSLILRELEKKCRIYKIFWWVCLRGQCFIPWVIWGPAHKYAYIWTCIQDKHIYTHKRARYMLYDIHIENNS